MLNYLTMCWIEWSISTQMLILMIAVRNKTRECTASTFNMQPKHGYIHSEFNAKYPWYPSHHVLHALKMLNSQCPANQKKEKKHQLDIPNFQCYLLSQGKNIPSFKTRCTMWFQVVTRTRGFSRRLGETDTSPCCPQDAPHTGTRQHRPGAGGAPSQTGN